MTTLPCTGTVRHAIYACHQARLGLYRAGLRRRAGIARGNLPDHINQQPEGIVGGAYMVLPKYDPALFRWSFRDRMHYRFQNVGNTSVKLRFMLARLRKSYYSVDTTNVIPGVNGEVLKRYPYAWSGFNPVNHAYANPSASTQGTGLMWTPCYSNDKGATQVLDLCMAYPNHSQIVPSWTLSYPTDDAIWCLDRWHAWMRFRGTLLPEINFSQQHVSNFYNRSYWMTLATMPDAAAGAPASAGPIAMGFSTVKASYVPVIGTYQTALNPTSSYWDPVIVPANFDVAGDRSGIVQNYWSARAPHEDFARTNYNAVGMGWNNPPLNTVPSGAGVYGQQLVFNPYGKNNDVDSALAGWPSVASDTSNFNYWLPGTAVAGISSTSGAEIWNPGDTSGGIWPLSATSITPQYELTDQYHMERNPYTRRFYRVKCFSARLQPSRTLGFTVHGRLQKWWLTKMNFYLMDSLSSVAHPSHNIYTQPIWGSAEIGSDVNVMSSTNGQSMNASVTGIQSLPVSAVAGSKYLRVRMCGDKQPVKNVGQAAYLVTNPSVLCRRTYSVTVTGWLARKKVHAAVLPAIYDYSDSGIDPGTGTVGIPLPKSAYTIVTDAGTGAFPANNYAAPQNRPNVV